MVKCAVPGCKNDSRKQNKSNSNISFHRFPKNRELINAWFNAIKKPNWEPNMRSFVCSIHFSDSSISETKKGLRKLGQDAIPELYLEDYPSTSNVQVLSALKSEDDTSNPASESGLVLQKFTPRPVPVPASVSVLEEITPRANDTPRILKLKRRLKLVHEIAKRRRLRCNALYTQRNRLKKKVDYLTKMVTELKKR